MWKAPSFCYAGEDPVTFVLHRPDRIQLVFHRATNDRAVVTFTDLDQVDAADDELVALVAR
jgi:hypothetical protein